MKGRLQVYFVIHLAANRVQETDNRIKAILDALTRVSF